MLVSYVIMTGLPQVSGGNARGMVVDGGVDGDTDCRNKHWLLERLCCSQQNTVVSAAAQCEMPKPGIVLHTRCHISQVGTGSARKQACAESCLITSSRDTCSTLHLCPPHLTTLATIDSASAAEPTPSLDATSAREMRE